MDVRNLADQIVEVTLWEIRGLARSPFLAIFSFILFFSLPSPSIGKNVIEARLGPSPYVVAAHDLYGHIAMQAVASFYVPLVLVVSFILMNSITKEFDSGLAKFYFSLPISRLAIVVGKLLSMSLVLFSIETLAVLSYAFLIEPWNFLGYSSIFEDSLILFSSLFIELLFILGVVTYACMLAPRSWVAIACSTISLYSFLVLDEVLPQAKWYLPPYVFIPYIGFTDLASLVEPAFLAISAVLLLISTYLFVKKIEVD